MTASTDDLFMQRCLTLAEKALANGEVPVGSIVVRESEVWGEGFERTRELLDLTAHAETQALVAACKKLGSLDLSGCTLYTTVEPCVLCGYAIRRSGITRVVFGIPTSQAGAFSSQYALLKDASLAGWPKVPDVSTGVRAAECASLMAIHANRRSKM